LPCNKAIGMDLTAFEAWLGGISALTEPQRRRAWQALALSEAADSRGIGSPNPAERGVDGVASEPPAGVLPPQAPPADQVGAARIAELGQRRVDSLGCPHCANRDVVRWGAASGLPRYRCKACRRTFNALTKTPLAKLRLKDKWAAQTEALIEGVSTAKAARRCGVHYTTAFRWRHRFLASLAGDKPKTLAGIVEGDETFILNPSRASERACRESPASEAVNRPSAACPPSRYRSSSRATGRARPRTRC
jgi:transposase-like protein